jgi:hypothetical protein
MNCAEEKGEDKNRMATSIATKHPGSFPTLVASTARPRQNRRRHIDPQAGHALEILGHAIGYLTDEFVESGAAMSSRNSQLAAVQLLMSLNRQVYFECAFVPTFRERLRSALHLRTA